MKSSSNAQLIGNILADKGVDIPSNEVVRELQMRGGVATTGVYASIHKARADYRILQEAVSNLGDADEKKILNYAKRASERFTWHAEMYKAVKALMTKDKEEPTQEETKSIPLSRLLELDEIARVGGLVSVGAVTKFIAACGDVQKARVTLNSVKELLSLCDKLDPSVLLDFIEKVGGLSALNQLVNAWEKVRA